MNIAYITDTHWGARSNSRVFLEYMFTWYTDEFFPRLKKEGITQVVHGGDLFDNRTNINFLTLSYFNKFLALLESEGITFHYIPGNHDLYYKDSNELNSVAELTHGCKNFIIYSDVTDVVFGDTTICMLPWLNVNNQEKFLEKLHKSKADVVVGHLEVAGFKMYKNSVSEHGLDPNVFKKFDLVLSGHYHHRSTIGNITYLGSAFYLTWQDYNDWRGFTLFDTTTKVMTPVQNEYSLFTEVYYDDTEIKYLPDQASEFENMFVNLIVKKKEHPSMFLDFVNALQKSNLHSLAIIDETDIVVDHTPESVAELTKPTKLVIDEYYHDTIVDKDSLSLVNELSNEIYNEAVDTMVVGE